MEHELRHDWTASRWDCADAEDLRGVRGEISLQCFLFRLLVRTAQVG